MLSSEDLPRFLELRERFFAGKNLRAEFEQKFSDPRRTFGERFVWDYWHIPGQYTVIRTPARSFFSPKEFARFENALLKFGGDTLGCNGISEPWLSYYIEGCSQSLHSDNPHGPWAYVYSLTPWKTRKFTGGETLIARPELLQYWENFSDKNGYEWGDFFVEVPAMMDQLLVFDPRLPHGVKEVRGVKEPREGRLVVHGWFTEPRPFVSGGLQTQRKLASLIDAQLSELHGILGTLGGFHGSLSARVSVAPDGHVSQVKVLKNTLIDLSRQGHDPGKPERALRDFYRAAKFPKARTASTLTIPILYRT